MMGRPLRVLQVEDNEDDAKLVIHELRRGGYDPVSTRVDTERGLLQSLENGTWDIVLSDYALPNFDGLAALRLLQHSGLDLPFILVSGTIGEEVAVAAMKAGAHDYLLKDNLKRLVPTVEREIRESQVRVQGRQAEEGLRASETRFRSLVSSMEDIVFTLDGEQRYTGVFGRWLERERLTPDHFLGKTAREIVGPDTAGVHEAANAQALAGEPVIYEWSLEGPEGTRHFQTSLSPLRGSSGGIIGLVGVARETSGQKRAEAQLLVSDRMASVGTLAAGVAHEINNPLAAVLANLDFLREGTERIRRLLEEGGERNALTAAVNEIDEPLRDARDAADRVRQIVKDLKIFSRSEEDRRGPVDVQRVMESTLRMAWNEIRHRARLVKDYGRTPPVEANESRLGQVFLNLIVNAAQSIPEGSAETHEIRVRTWVDRGRVFISISDTGRGIPSEARKRIFTPFFTTKPVGVGTGLGLSICHRIVTSLGGEITFESAIDRGTEFRIALPAADLSEQPSAALASSTSTQKGRVLVVDDEPIVMHAVRRTLARDHDVTVATNPLAALELITSGRRYDVILCDLMMPQMTGMDLYDALQRTAPEQADRMVFMTGGAFTPRAREFLDAVRNQRIEKPFDTNGLQALINGLVRDQSLPVH